MSIPRLLPLAASAATAVLVVALYFYGATPVGYWTEDFTSDGLRCAGLLVLMATVLRFCARQQAPVLLASGVLLYLAGGLGLAQSAAALLLPVSSWLLGRRLFTFMFPAQACAASAALLCGLAVYLAVFGIMIHYPVNYRTVYLVLLAAPLIADFMQGRRPPWVQELAAELAAWTASAKELPYWYFAAATIGLTLLARLAFFPTLGYDDNALHLGLWTQLTHDHVYAFDHVFQIWELAPFAVDLLHASVNLVAGADARGASNLVLLAVLLRQLWSILGIFGLATGNRVLVLLLFSSTPMTGYLLTTLQTELFMALLAASGARFVLELRGNWCSPHSAALLAVAALSCATKLPGAGLGIMILAAACLQLWATRGDSVHPPLRNMVLLAAFTALLATVAFNAYLTAWRLTGNPVFPLYNAIFLSPYFDASNYTDLRWIKGFTLSRYWDLFFNTAQYYESENFVAGFQYLLLLPLGLVVLLLRPLRQHATALLLPLLGYGLFVFAATQYWRYQFPVFPLASAVIGALLVPHYSPRGLLLVRGALVTCIVLNAVFYPGITWFFKLDTGRAYTEAGKREYIEQYAPARTLTEWVNHNAPGSRVLYPQETAHGATLDGDPIYVNQYSPTHVARVQSIRDEAGVAEFLRNENIDYVITLMNDMSTPGGAKWALREYLSHAGIPVLKAAEYILYRVAGHDLPYRQVFALAGTASIDGNPRELATVATGGITMARYRVGFTCESATGNFVAQINWDVGMAYYRLIPCRQELTQFAEAIPVPAGASSGVIFGTVQDAGTALVNSLSLETN